MKEIIGTFNPLFNLPGFVITVFFENDRFFMQHYDKAELKKWQEVKVRIEKLNDSFEMLSLFDPEKPYHAFLSQNGQVFIGNYVDLSNFLFFHVDQLTDNRLKKEISDFLEDDSLKMIFSDAISTEEKTGQKYNFEKITHTQLKEKDLPEYSEIDLKDFLTM